MKIKWGALITEGRGKIGGTVASKNRNGAYLRNKVTPVNRNTPKQSQARNRLAVISKAWSGTLSEAQRQEWNGIVEHYQKTNIFGDTVKPTGKNLFTGLNVNLMNIEEDMILSPLMPQELGEITKLSVNPTVTAFEFGMSTANIADDTVLEIWATPPQTVGTNFVKSQFRLIGTYPVPADDTEQVDIFADYNARFGGYSAGEKVFSRIHLISTISGEKSPGIIESQIVAS